MFKSFRTHLRLGQRTEVLGHLDCSTSQQSQYLFYDPSSCGFVTLQGRGAIQRPSWSELHRCFLVISNSLTLRNCHTAQQQLHHFIFSPTMYESTDFSIPLQQLLLSVFIAVNIMSKVVFADSLCQSGWVIQWYVYPLFLSLSLSLLPIYQPYP